MHFFRQYDFDYFECSADLDYDIYENISNLQFDRGSWLDDLSFNFFWDDEGAFYILVSKCPLGHQVKTPPKEGRDSVVNVLTACIFCEAYR